jgi:hypothetical protein
MHITAPGDSLWTIAASRLAQGTGRDTASLTTVEVTHYWVRLCDLNRSRLRSGDMNLIYPGEAIVLPTVGG